MSPAAPDQRSGQTAPPSTGQVGPDAFQRAGPAPARPDQREDLSSLLAGREPYRGSVRDHGDGLSR